MTNKLPVFLRRLRTPEESAFSEAMLENMKYVT